MFRSKTLQISWVATEQYTKQEIKRYPRNANQLKETQSHFSATCPSWTFCSLLSFNPSFSQVTKVLQRRLLTRGPRTCTALLFQIQHLLSYCLSYHQKALTGIFEALSNPLQHSLQQAQRFSSSCLYLRNFGFHFKNLLLRFQMVFLPLTTSSSIFNVLPPSHAALLCYSFPFPSEVTLLSPHQALYISLRSSHSVVAINF